jgi:hypothetical protein
LIRSSVPAAAPEITSRSAAMTMKKLRSMKESPMCQQGFADDALS